MAPDIPWSRIIGMGNVLAHGNFEINPDIDWGNLIKSDREELSPCFDSRIFG